jgi:hypothetical protein
MDLEMVLNELSLLTPAPDIPTARARMLELIFTIRQATALGVKKVIRTQSNLQSIILAPNYPVARWRNDNEVDKEVRRFFTTLIAKAPFLEDISDSKLENTIDLSEFKHQGNPAIGLGIAYFLEALALSVTSEECWNCCFLELEFQQVDDDGEIIEERIQLIHACRSHHIREHEKWIRDRIKIEVYDGLDLWNRKEELFPSLEFCENVSKQLQNLSNGQLILKQIIKRLLELEDYCQNWQFGSFDSSKIPTKITPESDSRKRELEEKLTFQCPDGIKRLFSYHARMTPGAWRLHFYPEEQCRKIIIGYIGVKIQ